MKKVVIILVMLAFLIGLFISCNKNVCPAYVMENKTEQTENNS